MQRSAKQLDVARAAGVSVSTVSRALSNSRGISADLRSHILKLAEDLGYRPRGAAGSAVRTVRAYVTLNALQGGLAIFYSGIIDGMTEAATAAGLELEVRLIDMPTLDLARARRDDGLAPPAATLFVGLDADEAVLALYGRERPLVLVNAYDPRMRFDCIAPNNYYGAVAAADLLIQAGHRDLLHVRDQLRWTTLQRQRGFLAVVDRVPGATATIVDIRPGGDETIAVIAADRKAGKSSWTGVFAVHDTVAVRFIHGLEAAGLSVPGDISVVGFDDLPAASMMTPRLASIAVDTVAIGREAIGLVLRRLHDPRIGVLQLDTAVHPVPGGSVAQFG